MSWLVIIILVLAIIGGGVAYWLGHTKSDKARADNENKERAEDAEIASQPSVDRPLSRMRRKS